MARLIYASNVSLDGYTEDEHGGLEFLWSITGLQRAEAGAGDGNRTHTTSLEGWSSTIELRPRRSDLSRAGSET